jgi:hypothetical protein
MTTLSNVALASQFEILMSFKFDFQDGTGEKYIFETKDMNAPLGALPGLIYQWQLLSDKNILKLTFEAMPSPSQRKLKSGQTSVFMDFDQMTIQFGGKNLIPLQRSNQHENEELLEIVNSKIQ